MSHFWFWSAGLWLALAGALLGFPRAATDLLVWLGLMDGGPWASLELIVVGGALWLSVGAVGLLAGLVRVVHRHSNTTRSQA